MPKPRGATPRGHAGLRPWLRCLHLCAALSQAKPVWSRRGGKNDPVWARPCLGLALDLSSQTQCGPDWEAQPCLRPPPPAPPIFRVLDAGEPSESGRVPGDRPTLNTWHFLLIIHNVADFFHWARSGCRRAPARTGWAWPTGPSYASGETIGGLKREPRSREALICWSRPSEI